MKNKDLSNTIKNLLLKYIPSITIIYIFGSVAFGEDDTNSDIDIAFLATEDIDNLRKYNISQTLAIELKKNIDLINMSKSTEVINMQIISKGVCIYNKDDTNFEDNVYYKYIDLCEFRSGIVEDIKQTGKIYG